MEMDKSKLSSSNGIFIFLAKWCDTEEYVESESISTLASWEDMEIIPKTTVSMVLISPGPSWNDWASHNYLLCDCCCVGLWAGGALPIEELVPPWWFFGKSRARCPNSSLTQHLILLLRVFDLVLCILPYPDDLCLWFRQFFDTCPRC